MADKFRYIYKCYFVRERKINKIKKIETLCKCQKNSRYVQQYSIYFIKQFQLW